MIILEQHTVPKLDSPVILLDYAFEVITLIPSKSGIKKAIKQGEILVDYKQEKSGLRLKEGQTIVLVDLENKPPKPLNIDLEIIFEDEHIALINKPAGIEVSGNKYYTIQNALVANIGRSGEPDALRWARPVHRLDRPTSGLLLVAKTASSLMQLGQEFENRNIKKKYHAVVSGNIPDKGTITLPVNDKNALSEYHCLYRCRSLKTNWLSLAELTPHTGRTHQLRIHMAESGFPIAGDKQYGTGPILKGKGLFLASTGLEFNHPKTNLSVNYSIDHPEKFDAFMKREEERWNRYNK